MVTLVTALYKNTRSSVKTGAGTSAGLEIGVGVSLSLYVNDLVINAEREEDANDGFRR